MTTCSVTFIVVVAALATGLFCELSAVSQLTGNLAIPALFVFGDSLVDAGNNNHVVSVARANFYPYGIDFPGGVATGRFVDGYNAMDYLALKYLRLPLVPIFGDTSTKGVNLLHGVNFASGGSGIDPDVGRYFGGVTNFDGQIQEFVQVKQEIEDLIGAEAGQELISEAAMFVVTGGNDWLNTYYSPLSKLPEKYSVSEYTGMLIDKMLNYVQVPQMNRATRFRSQIGN